MLFGKKVKKVISIDGMSCSHCVAHVKEALNAIKGVKADVDLKSGSATVTLSGEVSDAQLYSAIDDAGFKVTGIKEA